VNVTGDFALAIDADAIPNLATFQRLVQEGAGRLADLNVKTYLLKKSR
jgi:hypothetical protein